MTSSGLSQRLFYEINQFRLIDPHSHINPHAPTSVNLADLLGYHYYTELAHSAGMPRTHVESPEGDPSAIDPKTKVARLVEWLPQLDNTAQVGWLIDLCREFFGFQDDQLTSRNWEALYDHSAKPLSAPDWEEQVLQQSGLDQVFLTNDFDDPLTGFDTHRYVPCLRTDDLVFKLMLPQTRTRLAQATQREFGSALELQRCLQTLFEHFVAHGAKACAISLPPMFTPAQVSCAAVEPVITRLLAGTELSWSDANLLSQFVFWSLAECCQQYRLPFDLMIGVNRRVYPAGVYQGQDLFDQRVSLIQYRELFSAFPQVTFPVSVLAQSTHHELVSYAWIFPNVVTHGHWWYSNLPAYIAADCRARLQAIPRNKQIGYYSDMYKLEFAWPKFRMYKQALARVLAEDFVEARRWSETRAIELARQVLRGNVESFFGTCTQN